MIRIADQDDFEYVKSVIFNDEMWARCSDDYSIKCDDTILNINGLWLVCMKNENKIGLASVHHGGNSTLEVHIYIPKENRGRGTKKVGLEILKWIKSNSIEQVHKINTKVPVIYSDVIRFATALGLKKEGIDRKSIMKNGMLIDRVCLGISLSEVK